MSPLCPARRALQPSSPRLSSEIKDRADGLPESGPRRLGHFSMLGPRSAPGKGAAADAAPGLDAGRGGGATDGDALVLGPLPVPHELAARAAAVRGPQQCAGRSSARAAAVRGPQQPQRSAPAVAPSPEATTAKSLCSSPQLQRSGPAVVPSPEATTTGGLRCNNSPSHRNPAGRTGRWAGPFPGSWRPCRSSIAVIRCRARLRSAIGQPARVASASLSPVPGAARNQRRRRHIARHGRACSRRCRRCRLVLVTLS